MRRGTVIQKDRCPDKEGNRCEDKGRELSASPGEKPQREPTLPHLHLGHLVSRVRENPFLLFKHPVWGAG